MAGQKFLFKNFLADPKVYALNQGYWATQIRTLLPEVFVEKENLYQTHFANGKKMQDGNPIYSALLKNSKAVRIIQEEPESEQPEISAWVSQTEVDGEAIQELVISMELTAITKQVVIGLVAEWLNTKTEVFETEHYIAERLKTLRSTSSTPSSSAFRSAKSISDHYKNKGIHREDFKREKAISEGLNRERALKIHVKNHEKIPNDEVPKKTKRGHKSTV